MDSKTPSKKFYCGWSGEASKALQPNSVFTMGPNGKLDVLEIDPQLGTAMGLQEGQKVYREKTSTVKRKEETDFNTFKLGECRVLQKRT